MRVSERTVAGQTSGATTNNGKSHLYDIWSSMKRRCENPNMQNYKYYGAKGIRVCPEWHNFKTFYTWALSNGYQDGLSIDRINPSGDYEPTNCQWMKTSDNAAKALETVISLDGVEGNLRAWARLLHVSPSTVSYHLNGGGLGIHAYLRNKVMAESERVTEALAAEEEGK